MPVDRVNIELPEINSLIRAVIKSRPTRQSEWSVRQKGFFYRLSVDKTNISNDVLSIAEVNDRLLFLARGEAPFTLAYCSAGLGPDDSAMKNVLHEIEEANKT